MRVLPENLFEAHLARFMQDNPAVARQFFGGYSDLVREIQEGKTDGSRFVSEWAPKLECNNCTSGGRHENH